MRADRDPPGVPDDGADARADRPASPAPPPRAPSPPRPRAATGDGTARETIVAYSLAPDDAAPNEPPAPPAPPAVLPVVEVTALDWPAVRAAADPAAVRARAPQIVAAAEALLDRAGGPGLLFDADRATPTDRAIAVRTLTPDAPLWFIGDLHGDLLALEAALALVRGADADPDVRPRLVFLGDLFDDGGFGLEVLLRVFELAIAAPDRICLVAGNHDVALAHDGDRFSASVSPSDLADRLNAEADPWATRAGALAVRWFASAPRALFLPDGLLVAHAGFPLVDLHGALEAHGDWNDPRALSDFTWTRAHPKARRKMPNRASRGSQFGYEDFADFCALATRLGRPVTHLVRGHDHVEDRWAVPPAYAAHPILTTVALSRRLERELFGPYVRVPTIARWVPGALPQVHRLHLPEVDVRALYPEPTADAEASDTSDTSAASGADAPADPPTASNTEPPR